MRKKGTKEALWEHAEEGGNGKVGQIKGKTPVSTEKSKENRSAQGVNPPKVGTSAWVDTKRH